MEQGLGVAHFLAHADGVGRALLGVLLLMSLASWYLIVSKALATWRMARQRRRFLARFQEVGDLGQVEDFVREHGACEPFSHLATGAWRRCASTAPAPANG